ncbi:MAG: Mrp/NBP35 family ATP-binding protein [candidate division WOR-3 bacterium]
MLKEVFKVLREIKVNQADIVSLKWISEVYFEKDELKILLKIPKEYLIYVDEISNSIKKALKEKLNIEKVEILASEKLKLKDNIFNPQKIEGVKKIVGIASGKGGVGKSTIAINLAVSLAKRNYNVGLFDADIYGPSAGRLLGIEKRILKVSPENKFIPIENFGIKIVSFSNLLNEGVPVIWRGSIAHKAFSDLLFNTNWGNLDYLIVDFPPGTGDIQLSICQLVSLNGVIIVTTPQKVSLDDVRRAINAFNKLEVEIIGIVENMSYILDTCKNKIYIFGKDGGKILSQEFEIPLICQIPLDPKFLELSDNGVPFVVNEPENELQEEIIKSFDRIIEFL